MAGGGTNSSLRKYLGSIKDTTTISLAKVNSGYKVISKRIRGLFVIFLLFSHCFSCYICFIWMGFCRS